MEFLEKILSTKDYRKPYNFYKKLYILFRTFNFLKTRRVNKI